MTLKSKIVKRLLLAAVLLFAQGWGVHVFAHAPSDRTPPTVISEPQAPSPAPAATQNPAATVGADEAGNAAVDGGPDDLSADEGMVMEHPGLPESWIMPAAIAIITIALWSLFARLPSEAPVRAANLAVLPLIGPFVRLINRSPYPLLAMKLVSVAVFMLVIVAGLFGTSYPERNLATTFFYHVSHNLDHLARESVDLVAMLLNPLGTGLGPLSAAERHQQMMMPLFPEEAMFTVQAALMVLGFWLAVQIVRHRGRDQLAGGTDLSGWRLLPMLAFIGAMTAMNLWLMAQDMEMRF